MRATALLKVPKSWKWTLLSNAQISWSPNGYLQCCIRTFDTFQVLCVLSTPLNCKVKVLKKRCKCSGVSCAVGQSSRAVRKQLQESITWLLFLSLGGAQRVFAVHESLWLRQEACILRGFPSCLHSMPVEFSYFPTGVVVHCWYREGGAGIARVGTKVTRSRNLFAYGGSYE